MKFRSWILVCLGMGLTLSVAADEDDSAERPLLDVIFDGETLQEAVAILATLSGTETAVRAILWQAPWRRARAAR